MEWVDILCQPPVLLALVPHLDRVSAHSLFSCARRLHLALKNSAELRVVVWTLSPSGRSPLWYTFVLESIAAAGDMGAMVYVCGKLRAAYETNDLTLINILNFWFKVPTTERSRKFVTYWRPLRYALCSALRHSQYDIVEYLTNNGFAQVDYDMMVEAIVAGDVKQVKYLDKNFPKATSMIFTESHYNPITDAFDIMDVVKYGEHDVRTINSATRAHHEIHAWLNR